MRTVERDGVQMSVAKMPNGAIRGAAVWEKDGRTHVAAAERVDGEVTFEFTYSGKMDKERVSKWVIEQLGGDEESEDFEGLF